MTDICIAYPFTRSVGFSSHAGSMQLFGLFSEGVFYCLLTHIAQPQFIVIGIACDIGDAGVPDKMKKAYNQSIGQVVSALYR